MSLEKDDDDDALLAQSAANHKELVASQHQLISMLQTQHVETMRAQDNLNNTLMQLGQAIMSLSNRPFASSFSSPTENSNRLSYYSGSASFNTSNS